MFGLAAGMVIGTLAQQRHLAGRLIRSLTATFSSPSGSAPRIRVVQQQEPPISLRVRSFPQASSWAGTSSEEESRHHVECLRLSTSEIALILIDVWDAHPNRGWAERAEVNIQNKLLPLLQVAREHRILIVHCPNGQKIHPSIKPLAHELLLEGRGHQTRLIKVLKQTGVKYLLYAGYASNMCILTRPTGIIEMNKAGFNAVLVRDASMALESPDLIHGELTHKAATYMVETNWGRTTKIADVIAALERSPVEQPRFQSKNNPLRHT
jgi:nicotinamidase-related amidase